MAFNRTSKQKTVSHWHGAGEHVEPESAAVEAILANPRVVEHLKKKVKLDRGHDIPYLAGYSKDGKTIYIDQHLPDTFKIDGKTVNTDQFLVRHEEVEKTLIDVLGYRYQRAHEIACGAENAMVREAGLDPVAYNKILNPFIKEAEHEELKDVPRDLDLTPYDDTDARSLEKRMRAAETE